MKHLSATTKELPTKAVLKFRCPFEVGDSFTTRIEEVDCLSCYKQIVKAQFNLKKGAPA